MAGVADVKVADDLSLIETLTFQPGSKRVVGEDIIIYYILLPYVITTYHKLS